ncbi:MAG: carboxypeptidase-like regulatory domain-containing protein [Gemmatimonadota bacterium]
MFCSERVVRQRSWIAARWRGRLATSLCLLAIAPLTGAAQIVRGVATDSLTGSPQAGVLVELHRAATEGSPLAAVLSARDGSWAVRSPGAGDYYLTAKRIGVRRQKSGTFTLQSGATLRLDFVLSPIGQPLPGILVSSVLVCSTSTAGNRIAELWDEVRTALVAADISLRDSLYRATVVRYARLLEAGTLRRLEESRSTITGVIEEPQLRIDPDSLLVQGFVHRERREGAGGGAGDQSIWHVPDAGIFASEAFLGTHCFSLRERTRDRARAGLLGLNFSSIVNESTRTGVSGTVWLDASTTELRFLEFVYSSPAPRGTGGELHFSRLDNGAWMMQRWFVRLPASARLAPPLGTAPGPSSWLLLRPRGYLREEGGSLDSVQPSRPG